MSKLIFISRYSKEISRPSNMRHELGIDFDEVVLDCGKCEKKTNHKYIGYHSPLRSFLEKTKHNYKCDCCGKIQGFEDRK